MDLVRRAVAALGLTGCLVMAGAARASITLDLIWVDTGTPTLTVLPSDPDATAGGDVCSSGFLSGAGVGRCLVMRISSTIAFGGALVSIGWDRGSGLAPDPWHNLRPGYDALGPLGADGTTLGAASPSFHRIGVVELCRAVQLRG